MPEEKRTLFSQAENDRYNVSNVLRDPSVSASASGPAETAAPSARADEDVEINVEEGAPFLDGIDPEATIGEYMQLNEEEEAAPEDGGYDAAEDETMPEDDSVPAEEDEEAPAQKEGLQSRAIRQQAEKARARFIDDIAALENEPSVKHAQEAEAFDEASAEELLEDTADPERASGPWDDEDIDEEAQEREALSFKDLARRIKKPRFKKDAPVEAAQPDEAAAPETPAEAAEEPQAETETPLPAEETIMRQEAHEQAAEEDSYYEEELAEARASQKAHSICEDLYQLQQLLEEGRSPFMHKTEVLVPRERTLRLIRSLTAICEVNPSYIEAASEERFAEDQLIDELVSEHTEDDYRPLERARDRAQAIIRNATRQADTILGDAKTLARQLLAETEAEIKEKFDAADEQIAVRMSTTREESTKKLNEARSELTTSRQRSVEILSKYLEKAESDYQGYWERAENTVMASLEQSESILGKAADIYRKELLAIHQDKQEINEILEHMKKYKKRSKR